MAESYHDAIMGRLGLIQRLGDFTPRAIPQVQRQAPQMSGPSYSGSGNPIVAFGRMLQQRGYRVGEHPAFGGVAPVHTRNSAHYRGRAIDVNYGRGGASAQERAKINAIMALARNYGLKSIWQAPGHYDHAHFYY